jgi:hypothetical protein
MLRSDSYGYCRCVELQGSQDGATLSKRYECHLINFFHTESAKQRVQSDDVEYGYRYFI